MIRRHTDPSHYHLITQTDHALLSAQLAGHLGNFSFSSLDIPTLTAIAHHDDGWPLHDDSPSLNDHQLPRDVFESTPAIALPIWSSSADRAASLHPYAGLLVSLHGLALSAHLSSATPRELFSLNQFQHQEFERQEHLRKQLTLSTDLPLSHGLSLLHSNPAEDLLRFHFRLLQAMDLVSLSICCTAPPASTTQDIHPHPGSAPIQLALTRAAPDLLLVDPWPFDQPTLTFQIPSRRLIAHPYNSETTFHSAYNAAPIEILLLTISSSSCG